MKNCTYDSNKNLLKHQPYHQVILINMSIFQVKKIFPSHQRQIIEQVKFTYIPWGKVFKNQANAIIEHGDEKTKKIENQTRDTESQRYKDLDDDDDDDMI